MQKGFVPIQIFIGLLIVGLAAGGGYYLYQQQSISSINSQIKDYESCVKLQPNKSFPAIYPGQCSAPDGRHFVQILSEEEKKKVESLSKPSLPTLYPHLRWEATHSALIVAYRSNPYGPVNMDGYRIESEVTNSFPEGFINYYREELTKNDWKEVMASGGRDGGINGEFYGYENDRKNVTFGVFILNNKSQYSAFIEYN